jgi:hypothetical protein
MSMDALIYLSREFITLFEVPTYGAGTDRARVEILR